MDTGSLYALGGAALTALGLFALIAIPHLLRKILALNVMAGGIFLLLVGLGQAKDPVAQALVLTGIVVAFASTALAVILLRRWFQVSGRATLEPDHAYPRSRPAPASTSTPRQAAPQTDPSPDPGRPAGSND